MPLLKVSYIKLILNQIVIIDNKKILISDQCITTISN